MKQRKGGPSPRKPRDLTVVGFCHPHESITPAFRKCLTAVLVKELLERVEPRIVGEFDHESSGVHVPDARCAIVEGFLAHPLQPDWLWMVDTDATFADYVLDQLIEAADPETAPIVGALAFGVHPKLDSSGHEIFNDVLACEWELFPTIYVPDEDGQVGMWMDYPRDQLVRVGSTGCHCVLVHRNVLADPRWRADGHPLPWFRTAQHHSKIISEDQFFFVKAGALGYPVHVHTGIKTGHVKSYVADEDLYLKQRAHP